MTFLELESNIRDYRQYNAVHRNRVLIIFLPKDDFNDIWGWIDPDRMFYEAGRRRIRYIVQNENGYATPNILRPSPDDLFEEWESATVVTWQQICM